MIKESDMGRYPKIDEAQMILAKIRKNTACKDMNIQANILDNDMKGVRDIMECLSEIVIKGMKALQIGSYTLAKLNEVRPISNEIASIYAGINDVNPAATMAEASLAMSRLNHYVLERIRIALLSNHELFSKNTLEASIEDLIDDL